MTWREYIVLAADLARGDSDASKRSAVSRAYYGAFNLTRRWLEASRGPIDRWATHRQVWDAFRQPELAGEDTRIVWERIGELGDDLRTLRNQADYDDSMPDLARHAPEAVIQAERIAALLAELDLAA